MDIVKELPLTKYIEYNEKVASAGVYFRLGPSVNDVIKVLCGLPLDQYINKRYAIFAFIEKGPFLGKQKIDDLSIESIAYVTKPCRAWKMQPQECLKFGNKVPLLLKMFSVVEIDNIKVLVTSYKNISDFLLIYKLDNPNENRHKGVSGLWIGIYPDIVKGVWGAVGRPMGIVMLDKGPLKQDLTDEMIERVKNVKITVGNKEYLVNDLGYIQTPKGLMDDIWIDLGASQEIKIKNKRHTLYIRSLESIIQIMTNQWLVPVNGDNLKICNSMLNLQHNAIYLSPGDVKNYPYIVSSEPISDYDVKYVKETLRDVDFIKPFKGLF